MVIFLKKGLLFLFYMCKCFACASTCVPRACLVPLEAQGRHQILWNWSYRWLRVITWVLGTEVRSSARAGRRLTAEPSLQSHFWVTFKQQQLSQCIDGYFIVLLLYLSTIQSLNFAYTNLPFEGNILVMEEHNTEFDYWWISTFIITNYI